MQPSLFTKRGSVFLAITPAPADRVQRRFTGAQKSVVTPHTLSDIALYFDWGSRITPHHLGPYLGTVRLEPWTIEGDSEQGLVELARGTMSGFHAQASRCLEASRGLPYGILHVTATPFRANALAPITGGTLAATLDLYAQQNAR